MLSKFFSLYVVPALLLLSTAQASTVDKRSVGALTPLSAKSKICNVLDYGGVADNKTDIGPAIELAFSSCASAGGATLYIPPGNYVLLTGVILKRGGAYAIQLDGLITLSATGSFGGNAILIQTASDIELFSSNGKGAINGQGYIQRITGSGQNARLIRFLSCSDISVHDIILVDSPTFHLVFNDVSNAEVFHITIRGPNQGGSDGIDIVCTDNCYLHHIEVTNRDECISVKSPSENVLIEEIYCNQSGGMSIGSVTANVDDAADGPRISNITMRNIYAFQNTQMLMIKTYPGGDGAMGYVKDSVFENFWSYDSAYGLDLDQYWQYKYTPNTGAVALSGLTFRNFTGTIDNGRQRGAITIRGSDIVPLTDITLESFDMWTETYTTVLNHCNNVYGTGYCVASSTQGQALTTFTSTATSYTPPAAYTSPISPAWGVSDYGLTIPIPVYTPAALWPVSSAAAVKANTNVAVAVASATSTSSSAIASSTAGAAATATSASSTKAASATKLSTSASSSPSTKAASSAMSSSSITVTVSTTLITSSTSAWTTISKPYSSSTSSTLPTLPILSTPSAPYSNTTLTIASAETAVTPSTIPVDSEPASEPVSEPESEPASKPVSEPASKPQASPVATTTKVAAVLPSAKASSSSPSASAPAPAPAKATAKAPGHDCFEAHMKGGHHGHDKRQRWGSGGHGHGHERVHVPAAC